ncbi:MAG TPA: alpha-ketoglutarate-dependent dioxygenase AlkB [Alphaproteobacteria bacterium]|nr:alpha-ketoglutarate-dependent dioxygenase AlkB [Alphaproteobacteria bacterium]
MDALQEGVSLWRGWLDPGAQRGLLAEITALLCHAPPFRPVMPRNGRPFSVRMSNAGRLGWISDRDGYRYQSYHPETGRPWPSIPEQVLDVWRRLAGYPALPEACLINLYDGWAKMGLHQDRDEAALDAPVLSISLGAVARFRLGGNDRSGSTRSLLLQSGDVLALAGPARLCFHGIDRVFAGTSSLPGLPEGIERINLTLRRVEPAR